MQAARLTAVCRRLRRLGLEISSRPLLYAGTPQLVLDSFLNYTNATRYTVSDPVTSLLMQFDSRYPVCLLWWWGVIDMHVYVHVYTLCVCVCVFLSACRLSLLKCPSTPGVSLGSGLSWEQQPCLPLAPLWHCSLLTGSRQSCIYALSGFIVTIGSVCVVVFIATRW